MKRRLALGSLAVCVAAACSGRTLTVDDDPNASGTGGDSGTDSSGSTGSRTNSSSSSMGGSVSGGSGGDGSSSGGSGGNSVSGGSGGNSVSGGSGGNGSGGGASGGSGGEVSVGGSGAGAPPLPCDVLEAEGHPCVAAHSTVRLLRHDYDGPLYEVCRISAGAGPSACTGEALDIGATANGYADAQAQDDFCGNTSCYITVLYDQSGRGNHLEPSPPGSAKPTPSNPVGADSLPTTIHGHDTYGMLFRPGMGYRAGCNECNTPIGDGMPVGDEPQTVYMVTSQHDLINGCCFDYGNAETTANNDGNGTVEAVYVGHGVIWGTGSGDGPWVMGDLENGLFAGWENGSEQGISTSLSLTHDFIIGVLVGDTAELNGGRGRFALYGGDAQTGELTTMYDGMRPERPGYVPMQKQGSVVLSIAGDNSDGDGGRFYEGAIATGAASVETLNRLQYSVVEAQYGQ